MVDPWSWKKKGHLDYHRAQYQYVMLGSRVTKSLWTLQCNGQKHFKYSSPTLDAQIGEKSPPKKRYTALVSVEYWLSLVSILHGPQVMHINTLHLLNMHNWINYLHNIRLWHQEALTLPQVSCRCLEIPLQAVLTTVMKKKKVLDLLFFHSEYIWPLTCFFFSKNSVLLKEIPSKAPASTKKPWFFFLFKKK